MIMNEFKFGKIEIGDDKPVVIIAEAACEHQGDLGQAKKLVDLAREAGADIVKFQLHVPEAEMIPDSIRFWAGSMDSVLERVNLSIDSQKELMAYCDQANIQYMCTPFCAKAADMLESIGISSFKIGSGELTNIPMIRHIARKGKPMILSTGMASMEEVEETVAALQEEKAQFMLLHCVSAYPPSPEELNLRFILKMRENFGVLIGYSDHTKEMTSALGAVALGARVIEKHLTISHMLEGPDHEFSLEPDEFRAMVNAIRDMEASLGSDKKVHSGEHETRKWAHHSVVSVCDIPADAVIDENMVGVKRPGWGVPAKHLPEFYGRVAAKDIKANSLLAWDDLKG